MYNRNFATPAKDGRHFFFNPEGPLYLNFLHKSPVRLNAKTVRGLGGAVGVRMFIGFSVGMSPKYSMDKLIAETKNFLSRRSYKDSKGVAHKFPMNASFVSQRGIYTYTKAGKLKGSVVEEAGAQLIILDTTIFNKPVFLKVMQGLAEYLVVKLEQEAIFVQVQEANVVQDTWMVVP
jgi:hypothetical protein